MIPLGLKFRATEWGVVHVILLVRYLVAHYENTVQRPDQNHDTTVVLIDTQIRPQTEGPESQTCQAVAAPGPGSPEARRNFHDTATNPDTNGSDKPDWTERPHLIET